MRRIGSTDLSVHSLCLGTNVFGWTVDERGAFAVLDAYAEAGGNFIDTADSYSAWAAGNSGGESETIIGRWMASRANRDGIVVATKVGKLAGVSRTSRRRRSARRRRTPSPASAPTASTSTTRTSTTRRRPSRTRSVPSAS
jgi:aryl-alcohol dehydrogenase-like predicted oxidoreductase